MRIYFGTLIPWKFVFRLLKTNLVKITPFIGVYNEVHHMILRVPQAGVLGAGHNVIEKNMNIIRNNCI